MDAIEQNNDNPDDVFLHLKHAPILSKLYLSDLARLVPHMKEQRYVAGKIVLVAGTTADTLYLIMSGEVQITSGRRSMGTVNQGFLGEESILAYPVYFYQVTVVSPTARLLSFDSAEIAKIVNKYPHAHKDFSFSLLRFGLRNKEIEVLSSKKNVDKTDTKPEAAPTELHTFMGWLLALLIPIIFYHLPWFADIPINARIFISIFAITITMWVFKLVPDYVAGLLPIVVVLILGITPSSVILDGFRSPSFFMAMSIFALSAVVVSSGLVYRILLIVLRKIPPTQFLYNLMVTLSGALITPVIPSVNGRVGLTTPLLTDLITALGYRQQGTNANRLAVSTFFGISLFSSVFMTSKSINFVVFGMLSIQDQNSFHWLNWALSAAVVGLISLGIFLLLSTIIYRSDENPRISLFLIENQLKILGRMSPAEWGAIAGVIVLAIGIVTTSIHAIEPAWISLTLMFLFLALGTISKKDFQHKIDWPFLFFLGTLIGLTKATSFLNIDQMISVQLAGLTELMQENIYLMVLLLAGIIFILRLVMSINATVVIMASIFLPISGELGINGWVMGFIILTLSESFIFPYQCSYYMMFREFNEKLNLYTESSFLKFNLWSLVIRILAVYSSIPFWQFLEILQ